MPRLRPVTVAIRTLKKQHLPGMSRITDEEALEWLRFFTGQDFGRDVDAWSKWLKANRWAYFRYPDQSQS